MTSRTTEQLIAPIETWLRQFEDADMKTAPEDFLVGFGSIRKSFVDFYEEGTETTPIELLTALAASEFVLADAPAWVDDQEISPLQPLSAHWLPLIGERNAEFRLAVALNGLHPLELDGGDLLPIRGHLEPITVSTRDLDDDSKWDDDIRETLRSEVAWNRTLGREVVWDRQADADGLGAILERRLSKDHGPPFDHVDRGSLPAGLADIQAFIDAETGEEDFSRLAFVLSLLDLWGVSAEADAMPRPRITEVSYDYAVLKLALSRPSPPSIEEPIPVHRDAYLLARKGDRDSAVEFARGHLRKHGLTVPDGPDEPAADFERVVAALLFPIDDTSTEALIEQLERREQS